MECVEAPPICLKRRTSSSERANRLPHNPFSTLPLGTLVPEHTPSPIFEEEARRWPRLSVNTTVPCCVFLGTWNERRKRAAKSQKAGTSTQDGATKASAN